MIIGFSLLGLLIGALVGFTAESVVATFLPLLLTLSGGSILVLVKDLKVEDQNQMGKILGAFSLSTLVALLLAIYVAEHQLLSPAKPPRVTAAAVTEPAESSVSSDPPQTIADRKYLRNIELSEFKAIDMRVRTHDLTKDDAYDLLKKSFEE